MRFFIVPTDSRAASTLDQRLDVLAPEPHRPQPPVAEVVSVLRDQSICHTMAAAADRSVDDAGDDLMALRPDYGLRMRREGLDAGTVQHFYDVPIDGFEVLGDGRYTLAVDRMVSGERHCISFDFGQDILAAVLSALPRRTANAIRRELARGSDGPKSFKVNSVRCDWLSARLGELQRGRAESFVPLVVTGIAIRPR